jgi:hypothetical protein
VDVDAEQFEQPQQWEPHPNARARAQEHVTLLDLDLHIERYLQRCRDRKTEPRSGEWLRWVLEDEQKARIEAKKNEPFDDEYGTPLSWSRDAGR